VKEGRKEDPAFGGQHHRFLGNLGAGRKKMNAQALWFQGEVRRKKAKEGWW